VVSANFFQTLGVPLIAGREFDQRDRFAGSKVAVVNRAFAERYLEDVNPLGRRISFSHGNAVELDTEIIGVVENLKSTSLREEPRLFTYTPYWQEGSLVPMTFYLLSQRDEAQLGPSARSAVQQIDPDLPLLRMESMAAIRDRRVDLERSFAMLSSALAAIATLLSTVGLYGLVAYGVTRRTVEIGVRVAFGARRRDVLAIVVRESLTYLALGLAIGIPATLALGRYLRAQLFGLQPHDPLAILIACAFLIIAVLVASLAPARRAASVDPAEALRQ
jgi:ABC-type antimicrobial peptide transport system permease subunit